MLPFEFVATATDSPMYSPGGSLRKFGTAVNGISGTPVIVAFACANAGPAASVRMAHVKARIRVIDRSLSRAEPIPWWASFQGHKARRKASTLRTGRELFCGVQGLLREHTRAGDRPYFCAIR